MGQFLWLIPVGVAIGAYGTLIGAGGGFVLVPFLLLLYPKESPETITSISLAVVFFNALSGSVAYARMGRVDYRSGLLFSAATVPGAILGALTTGHIPRRAFDATLGLLMILASAFLVVRPSRTQEADSKTTHQRLSRTLVESDGTVQSFSYNPTLGVAVSFLVGYLSSLLGIGGGVFHVPVLASLLAFPVHIATATSQFMLAIMALTGTAIHIMTGAFHHGVRRTAALTVGVLLGAPLGAWLSSRVRADWITRGLAIALGSLGIRLLVMAF